MAPYSIMNGPLFLACCTPLLRLGDNSSTATTVPYDVPDTLRPQSAVSDGAPDITTLRPQPAVPDDVPDTTIKPQPTVPLYSKPKEKGSMPNPTIIHQNISLMVVVNIPTALTTAKKEKESAINPNMVLQINIFNKGSNHAIPESTFEYFKGLHGKFHATEKDQVEALPWWKTSIIYQIYPRSFMDSDADGTGDLKGITSRVKYLKSLGIGAVWLSPIYVSPMADFGYDVANFTDIDPIFGTLKDFDELLVTFHNYDLKVIMDFIPNHSSDKHPWFEKSVKKIDPYTNYYVWMPAKAFDEDGNPIPPNNWLSLFGGSAWSWNEERQEFYLHQFLNEQPDLNVRNPAVMDELDKILKFWLDRGVDGFRIDALKFLFEVEDFSLDEPVFANSTVQDKNEYFYLDHIHSVNRPETVDAVRRWRKISDSYSERIIIVEVYDDDIKEIVKYYGSDADPIAHFPFNFYLITELNNRSDVTGINLKKTVDIWMKNMPNGKWPNWVIGNHDRGRISSRLGSDLVDVMNALVLLLPGTPTTYYGEEIGMEDTFVTYKNAQDPFGIKFGPERYTEFGRDPPRSPMQWDNTTNAGFSTANSTWLPHNENYMDLNVKFQNGKSSHLENYKKLAKLRQCSAFSKGIFEHVLATEDVFAFYRSYEKESYLVIINTSTSTKKVNLVNNWAFRLPKIGALKFRSSFHLQSNEHESCMMYLNAVNLLPGEIVVLEISEEYTGNFKSQSAQQLLFYTVDHTICP